MLTQEAYKQFFESRDFQKKWITYKAAFGDDLDGDLVLEFEAQKSAYSDVYYFNISLYPVGQPYPACFSTRLTTDGEQTHNWQLLTDKQFHEIMERAIETYIRPILQTPLSVLGKESRIWLGCLCHRDKCEACWVEKNLWEARGDEP